MKRLLLLVGLVFWACLPLSGSEKHRTLQLLITSDLHGWLSTAWYYPTRRRKGLLHLADAIRRERERNPDLLLLDAGDLLQGSPLSYFVIRQPEMVAGEQDLFFQTVQNTGFDAVAVGNHDLILNPVFERQYVPNSRFHWLSANLIRKGQPVFEPYTVFERKGLKVAVIGFTTPGVALWLSPQQLQGIQVQPLEVAARQWLKTVRHREHPDFVIGLFHVGLNPMRDDENSKISRLPPANGLLPLLETVTGFDLVISGHDHRLAPSRSGQKLRYIKQTPVVSGGSWGEALIDLKILLQQTNGAWQTERIISRVHRPAQDPEIDKDYVALLPQAYQDHLLAELPWQMTSAPKPLITDCFNHLHALAQDEPQLMGTLLPPVAIETARRDFGRKLRRIDLWRWLPYENRTVTTRAAVRDIALLTQPLPEFGSRKVAYNRRLYPWFKEPLDTFDPPGVWLDADRFEKRITVKISDYHYFGGGGIIPRLFWETNPAIQVDAESTRDRLFMFLQTASGQLPETCRFLKPAPALDPVKNRRRQNP